MSARRRLARATRLLLLLPGLLLAALLLGALLPRNVAWREPPLGPGTITIGIDASLAHAELILPVATAGFDWRATLPAGSVPPGATHLAIGWGDAAFYRATPSWADLDARLALKALFASEGSLLHITPLAGPSGRSLRLTADEHRSLVAFVQAEIAPGAAQPGYGAGDIFLPATSRYNLARTCNQWVSNALATAGVRVGRWTPLAQSLMWRFEAQEETHHG